MSPEPTALTARLASDPYWGWTVLDDPGWRKAWDAAPRYLFVPDAWFTWDGERYVRDDRATEPDAWQAAVEADEPVITQIDGGVPSCSNSTPSLVAAMLDALDLRPGMRVFESGAGTGWTPALMYHRVAPDGVVVSVEYDRQLAKEAQNAAFDVGAYPVVRHGDGTAGAPDMAPFDRVSATHSVDRIPHGWIGQTKPGGLVVAPLRIAATLDVLVRLTVAGDGSASGPIAFPVAFMADRVRSAPATQDWADGERRHTKGLGFLDVPRILLDRRLWVLQLAIPGLAVTGPAVEDGDDTVWLSAPDGSWAVAWVPQGASWTRGETAVDQYGPRSLWSVAEAAWLAWEESGRPGFDEYGLSVGADGVHRVWMREPGSVVAELDT
jgi:protein-L-isoaspartate O-methyltransferase